MPFETQSWYDPSMVAQIIINAQPRKPVEVAMVGVEYKVKPPKMSVLAIVAKAAAAQEGPAGDSMKVLDHIENLVKLMFKAQATGVMKRLDDPDDELDYQHIIETAEAVIEAGTGNPSS